MSGKWDPKQFKDESKEVLKKLIKADIKHGKSIIDKAKVAKAKQSAMRASHKSETVVDFMELLKKSVANKEKGGKSKPTAKRAHK